MNPGLIPISDWQLSLAVLLVLLAGTVSAALRLGLLRSLLWGSVRTFLQLTLIGYALVYIFRWNNPWVTAGLILLMGIVASVTAAGRGDGAARTATQTLLVLLAILSSTFLVAGIVVGLIVSPRPWYDARVLITITGMIMGNSMNAIALAWERLRADIAGKRLEVEALISFGATPWEAVTDIAKTAVRAGMLPTVNSLAVVGLVSLPGMMTGQILAGADPREAVRYQIVVMLMIAAATALGCLSLVGFSYRRLFNADGSLATKEPGKERF